MHACGLRVRDPDLCHGLQVAGREGVVKGVVGEKNRFIFGYGISLLRQMVVPGTKPPAAFVTLPQPEVSWR